MRIAIIGASGFGREVADIVLSNEFSEIVFLSSTGTEKEVNGFPVFKEEEEIVNLLHDQGYSFAIGIGNPETRKLIKEKYEFLDFPNIVHPSATFGYRQRSEIEHYQGNIITAGVRYTNGIKFGNFGIVNLNSTVGHDCTFEDYVSIMPGVNISGNVHLGSCCYIGTGASIIQGGNHHKLLIGDNSVIGAGAVVTNRMSLP